MIQICILCLKIVISHEYQDLKNFKQFSVKVGDIFLKKQKSLKVCDDWKRLKNTGFDNKINYL